VVLTVGETDSPDGVTVSIAPFSLSNPRGITVDDFGNLYVADTGAQVIRKLTQSGSITTIAGVGSAGYSGDGGPAISATFRAPFSLTSDATGSLYITDLGNAAVRRISPDGIIGTVAGTGLGGYSGDGGPATSAQLSTLAYTTAIDASGAFYIANTRNSRIRRVTPDGIITTVAGNGTAGYSGDGGPAIEAQLNNPSSVAVDSSGNLYIVDELNDRIRRVTPDGKIDTVAGTGVRGYSGDGAAAVAANLNLPWHVTVDKDGKLYFSDTGNRRIRVVSADGVIHTIAGNGISGYSGDGGLATNARINGPLAVAVSSDGSIYFIDSNNNCIRKVTADGLISTILGKPN
jgi:sugar lactone lactonase YvrE